MVRYIGSKISAWCVGVREREQSGSQPRHLRRDDEVISTAPIKRSLGLARVLKSRLVVSAALDALLSVGS